MLVADPVPRSVIQLEPFDVSAVRQLLRRFGLSLHMLPAGADIPASFWGAPEAGLEADRLFARPDTPIHSVLHEACHYVCMSAERRLGLSGDAGGDHLEECAVCYLQVLLADELPLPMSRARMLKDMDAWGYTFREGNAASWFAGDGWDARRWLQARGLIDAHGRPAFIEPIS